MIRSECKLMDPFVNYCFAAIPHKQVRVKILASGVCGTDEYARSGADPEGKCLVYGWLHSVSFMLLHKHILYLCLVNILSSLCQARNLSLHPRPRGCRRCGVCWRRCHKHFYW